MRALLLSALLLLAGCVTPEEPAADTAPVASQPDAAASAPTPEVPDGSARQPIPVPVSFSGTTPEGVCGAFGCQWATEGAEDFHPIPYVGQAKHLAVQVTYGEQRPGMEFYVGLCTGDGASEAEVTCGDYTTAPSPMVVEFPLDTGSPVALSFGSLSTAAAPTGTMVFGAASFEVQGTLTVLPLA